MEIFGSTNKFLENAKDVENIPNLKIVGVVLVQCNLVDNQYQQKSEVSTLCPINLMLIC